MYITSISTYSDLMKNQRNSAIAEKIAGSNKNYALHIEQEDDNYTINGLFYYHSEYTHSELIIESESQRVIGFECSCNWCTEDSPCGHVGALFLKCTKISNDSLPYDVNYIVEEQKELSVPTIPYKSVVEEDFDYYKKMQLAKNSKELIQRVKQSITPLTIIPSEKIRLVPAFTSLNNSSSISFKIGLQKLYVIKNLEQFIYHVKHNEFFEFGRDFSSYLNYDYFDDDSKRILDFLFQHIQYIRNLPSSSSRSLVISDRILPSLYDLFTDLKDDYILTTSEIHEKCTLSFRKFAEGCEMKFTPTPFTLIDGYRYELNSNTILRTKYHKPDQLLTLFNLIRQGFNLLATSDLNSFYHLFLKDLVDDVEFIDFPYDLINNNEISRIELYGDLNKQNDLEISVHYIKNDGSKLYAFTNNANINDKRSILIENFIRQYAYSIDTDEHKAYLDMNQDKTYDFIKSGLDALKEYCDIYVSEALKSIGSPKHYAINLGVRVNAGLLELDVTSQDIPLSELADVLRNYKKRKKFHRLKSGELIYLESNELQELENIFDKNHIALDSMKDGLVQLPLYRSFQTDEVVNDLKNIHVHRAETFKDCIDNFKLQHHQFNIDSSYSTILRDYQKVGVHWMALLHSYGFNGILADDMGLGKTLQVISLIDSLKLKKPTLVICPASLILNWQDEVAKFSKDLKYLAIHGTSDERIEYIKQINDYNLCITSYDYIRRDIELLKQIEFDYVILDEAQYIKNHNTKNAQSVKQLKATSRLALTGTPIENSLAELWSIFDFLMPNYLYNYHHFRSTYEVPIVKDQDIEVQDKLKKLVEPFILRRIKTEVLKELPEKIEQTIHIELNEDETKLYLAHAVQVASSIEAQMNNTKFDHIQILAMITKLRQLCCEPRILFENIHEPSSKMNACMNIIETFKENKKKLLVFSSFTSIFPLLSTELKKSNIKYHTLTGDTDKVLRRELVKQFQSDDSTVFLISLKAGGTGLNLTAAEGVIHFDPWWNISAQNQATDRSHRIGQKNIVQVYKLITQNTIEEKILKLQETKKNLADTFVENNEGTISKLTPEQLLDLFK
ncbi:DEAD/DEAH box helicase [Anaerorhabdus furcosa]|uniref:Superfamily II DNA or RNA helicase, SNF2 family n=1 Tax=Anaerorhabdus furcosa TaxID=118967 RepID=A0A1T4MJB4_9FIRM|nr:DEAD/DEAH box helicase [Anaerorhabdus furcosa]SJZ67033.1 Superfamily II DNA or RNA helicase, SNF2 family [Anaerorhabdus furcosa]